MPQFSANLGFLWTDLALPQAVERAGQAGFAAVECHWPFDIPAADLRRSLNASGLPLLGLNTRRGSQSTDFGVCAVPGREAEARAVIDEAIGYAKAVGAHSVHVMAGVAAGAEAEATFRAALAYALDLAGTDLVILIEPINPHDAPGYFLRDTGHASQIISDMASPNLRLMFDCYHVARSEDNVLKRLDACWPIIGHIQFAAVPDRGEPDQGSLNYSDVFAAIDAAGWTRPLGAEYKPRAGTDAGLGWMAQ